MPTTAGEIVKIFLNYDNKRKRHEGQRFDVFLVKISRKLDQHLLGFLRFTARSRLELKNTPWQPELRKTTPSSKTLAGGHDGMKESLRDEATFDDLTRLPLAP